jgi:Mediator complex subunit MED14
MDTEISIETTLPNKGNMWNGGGGGRSSMHQITLPVFKEGGSGVDKARYKNHTSMPIVNGNGNGVRDHSPPPKLERITEGSIPISLIAARVIRKSYGEFLNLAETYAFPSLWTSELMIIRLPAMSDVPKKKKMLEYLLETRRQMIKLLVLVKWAKVSKEVEQCIVLPPMR